MPADSLSLTSMTFVRQSFARNFYNSSKVMSSINMDGARLFLPDAASTEAVTMRQEGRTLLLGTPADRRAASTLRVGAFHPYLCYEARFSGVDDGETAGIDFAANDGSGTVIRTVYSRGRIVSCLTGADGTKELASKDVGQLGRVALRVQYTGVRFHVALLVRCARGAA